MSFNLWMRLALLVDHDVVVHFALRSLDLGEACVNALGYLADCLHNRQVSTIENVRGLDSSRNSSDTASNIICIGIVGYAVLSCFHCFIGDDRYFGNGEHENAFESCRHVGTTGDSLLQVAGIVGL